MKYLIDPPDRFSGSLQDWKDYLAELRRITDPDDQVRDAIEDAEAVIAEKEAPIRPIG